MAYPQREELPSDGQAIFNATFRNAFKQYPGDELQAEKLAWEAVEQYYERDRRSGNWVHKG
jgi:cation transport regulator ChaB